MLKAFKYAATLYSLHPTIKSIITTRIFPHHREPTCPKRSNPENEWIQKLTSLPCSSESAYLFETASFREIVKNKSCMLKKVNLFQTHPILLLAHTFPHCPTLPKHLLILIPLLVPRICHCFKKTLLYYIGFHTSSLLYLSNIIPIFTFSDKHSVATLDI